MTLISPLPFSNRLLWYPKSDSEGEIIVLDRDNVAVVVPFSEKVFHLIY